MVLLDLSEPFFIIGLGIGVVSIAVYLFLIATTLRLVSKNQMSGTLIGNLIKVLCIAWLFSGITTAMFGAALGMGIEEIEDLMLLVAAVTILWGISAVLIFKAIRKWKKEIQ